MGAASADRLGNGIPDRYRKRNNEKLINYKIFVNQDYHWRIESI